MKNKTKLKSLKAYPQLTKLLDKEGCLTTFIFYSVIKKEHSSIHDIQSERGIQKISSILGCCHSTTRRQIKAMMDLNWVWYENTTTRTDLRFISIYKILAHFNLDRKTFGQNIPYIGKETKNILRLQVLKQNFSNQDYIIGEKSKNFGKTITKLHQQNNTEALKFMLSQERKGTGFNINVDNTITRGNIAKLCSKKSKTTGRSYLNKIAQLGLVKTDIHRITKIKDYTDSNYKHYFDSSVYKNQNNELWMQLPNQVEFNPISDIWDMVNGIEKQLNQKGKTFEVFFNAPAVEVLSINGAYMDNRTSLSKKLRNNDYNLSNTVNKGLKVIPITDYTASTYLQKAQINASNILYN